MCILLKLARITLILGEENEMVADCSKLCYFLGVNNILLPRNYLGQIGKPSPLPRAVAELGLIIKKSIIPKKTSDVKRKGDKDRVFALYFAVISTEMVGYDLRIIAAKVSFSRGGKE